MFDDASSLETNQTLSVFGRINYQQFFIDNELLSMFPVVKIIASFNNTSLV